MAQQPRSTVQDTFVEDRSCFICGSPTLAVVHLEGLPDYVNCARCSAAFVLEEGGDRALYGSIPPEYPETRDFALKKWTSLEAIQALAEGERSKPGAPTMEEPPDSGQLLIEEVPQFDEPSFEPEDQMLEPALSQHEAEPPIPEEEPPSHELDIPPVDLDERLPLPTEDEPMVESSVPPFMESNEGEAVKLAEQDAEIAPDRGQEPPPGRRYRVRYTGIEPSFPTGACAHCLTAPADRQLIVVGLMTSQQGEISRRSYTLPLCRACHNRARARSEEARNARLLAHLASVLMSFVLMVAALALGIVNFEEYPLALNAGLLGLLALIGYGFPALLLLGRAARFPPPADAIYVRSTLMVAPQPNAGETLFDWRNQGYAERFHGANGPQIFGEITEVQDQLPGS